MKIIPKQNALSFVQKISDSVWIIKRLDIRTRVVTDIIPTLQASEDYVWTPQGTLLMGKDSKLYEYNPAKTKQWREVADFATFGITGFYRLALSPQADKIAVVVYTGKKP